MPNPRIEIDVPDGVSGNWQVSSFEVSEKDASWFNLGQAIKGTRRNIVAGKYKRICRNGRVIMSNTPAEIADHMKFILTAKQEGGHILINGLGLGVALKEILTSEKVKSVTVVEKSKDVIALVASTYLKDSRVKIIEADAYDYTPPAEIKYSAVWHDIWDDISSQNLPEMAKLRRKYSKFADWQGSWAENECRRQKRRGY
jgi:16S rRNA A1518/A1519 N6-dimethyltransferase RsmA/KsgA/DIM1 with predicted DNA glycosylase/AP lyase activity